MGGTLKRVRPKGKKKLLCALFVTINDASRHQVVWIDQVLRTLLYFLLLGKVSSESGCSLVGIYIKIEFCEEIPKIAQQTNKTTSKR